MCVCLSVCLSQSRRLAILSGIESSSVHRRYWRAIIVAHVCLSVCHRVVVRRCYVCLSVCLSQSRREAVLSDTETNSVYRRYWRAIMKNDSKLDDDARHKVQLERTFLARHVQKYLHVLNSITEKGTSLLCFRLSKLVILPKNCKIVVFSAHTTLC